MEEEEDRRKKVEAGKAKLAEYRQRKAQSDGQKKQKKKKKKRSEQEDVEQAGTVPTMELAFSKSGERVQQHETVTLEPESEISTTAEDYSSEVNGCEMLLRSLDDLVEEEDLHPASTMQELEEIRAAFGAEGVQQLQDFEVALKQRDGIITQLTANLQQARTEKNEVMREFLQLTEQSQKLQIQFQQLQAGESLRSSSMSSTAADLLQARQQVLLFQQQLDERDKKVKDLQEQLETRDNKVKDLEEKMLRRSLESDRHSQDLREQLEASKQKERLSSGEVLQLMGTVEALQKRCHQGSQSEGEVLQRLDHLRAELDEMYGQQIVQMKKELCARHAEEMEQLTSQLNHNIGGVNALNVRVIELQQRLQETQVLREKAEQDVCQLSEERSSLQRQVQMLKEDLRSKKSQSAIQEQLQSTIADLRAQLTAALEASSELEAKHESEITNYQIKLEMLEREKDAVLDRMAESQEAELERLRTNLLFSHEEELCRLREDLQRESQMNVDNLRDELERRHQETIGELQSGYEEHQRTSEQERVSLLQEVVALKNDLSQALEKSHVEELVSQLKDLQVEIHQLRQKHSGNEESTEALEEGREVLLKEMEKLGAENKDLRAEVDNLEKRTLQYENQLQNLKTQLQNVQPGSNYVDGGTLVEKNMTELMEKLQRVELERAGLVEQVEQKDLELKRTELVNAELVEKIKVKEAELNKLLEQKEAELKKLELEKVELICQTEEKEVELKRMDQEKTELLEQIETSKAELKDMAQEKAGLVKEVEQKERELQRVEQQKAGLVKEVEQKEVALQRVELEKVDLVKQAEQKEVVLKQKEVELHSMVQEKEGLVKQVEQEEVGLQRVEQEKAGLIKQLQQKEVVLKQKELELQSMEQKNAGLENQVEQKGVVLKQEVELRRLEQEKAGLEKQVEQNEAVLKQKEVEFQRMEQEKAGLVREVEQKVFELQRVEQEKVELLQKIEQKAVVLQRVEQEKAGLVNQVEQKEVLLNQKEVELQRVEQDKKGLIKEVEEIEVVLKQKEVALQKVEQEKSGLLKEVEQKEVELQRLEQEKGDLIKQMAQREMVLKQKEVELQRVEQEKVGLVKEVALQRVEEKKAEQAKQVEQKEAVLKQKEVELQRVEQEKAVLVKQVEQKEVELNQMAMELQRVEQEKTGLLSEVEQKEVALQRVKQEKEGLVKEVEVREAELQKVALEKVEIGAVVPKMAQETPGPAERKEAVLKQKKVELHKGAGLSKGAQVKEVGLKAAKEEGQKMSNRNKGEQKEIEAKRKRQAKIKAKKAGLREKAETGAVRERLAPPPFQGTAEKSVCAMQPRDDVKQETHTRSEPAATHTHPKSAAPITHTHDGEEQERVSDKQVESHHADSEAVPTLTHTDSMDGSEHVECRLQMEALRISLSQIHAAQVELLKQRLHTPTPKWEELTGQGGVTATLCGTAELQQDVRTKAELQRDVMTKLEEVHEQELERLRSYYSDQMREQEERYRNEIVLLHNKLEELTGSDALYSMPSVSPHTLQRIQMEEEVARVIVQMSVEFAKQSEMSRMNALTQAEGGAADHQEGAPSDKGETLSCSSSTQTQTLRDRGQRDKDKEDKEYREEEEEVTSLLPTPHTQDRLYHVIRDVLHATSLMEETIRTQPITHTDVPGPDSSSSLGEESLEVYPGVELPVGEAEFVSSVSCRLQKAVQSLVFIIADARAQLDHARLTQTALTKEKFSHDQQIAELMIRQEELQQRLQEERSAREKLTLQLQHAEGLIDGYSGERQALEDQVHQAAALQLQLETELQTTNCHLQQLQLEKHEMSDQQELLLRRQEVLKDGATDSELHLVEAAGDDAPEAGFLEETEKLIQEKVDVQRQAQKDHAELLQQVKELEVELEEQVRARTCLEKTHLSESTDLQQQIHALEKQLENNRRFLDEQAADREHEREIFQQEIQKLEEQLKTNPKPPADHREVEELNAALMEKSDWCRDLEQREAHLQEEVRDRDEEIERLEERVRALEEALLTHAEGTVPPAPPPTEKEDKQHAPMAGKDGSTLEALLQTEREALDRKEKEIVNLEEQLEQFRDELQNKSEEVQQLHMQLEIQRKEISTQQQELQARASLQAEVEAKNELVRELEAQVEYLHGEQDRLKRDSEEEVEQLNSVIEKLQQELSNIEHKQTIQDEENEDEEDELKQKMDQVQKELGTLKKDHFILLDKYESLQKEGLERGKENQRLVLELEDLLRERTAALVVAQVQVQALEESASSRVGDLSQRVEELQTCLEEKETELKDCRLEVEKVQEDAESLHLKISQLEEKLKEKMTSLSQLGNQEPDTKFHTKELESKTGKESETKVKSQTLLDKPTAGKEIESQIQSQATLDKPTAGQGVGLEVQSQGKPTAGKEVDSQVNSQTVLDKPSAGKGAESQVQSQTALDEPTARKEVESQVQSQASLGKTTAGKDVESQGQNQATLDKPTAGKEVELEIQTQTKQEKLAVGNQVESEVQSGTPPSAASVGPSGSVIDLERPAGKKVFLLEKLKNLEEDLSSMQKDQELQKQLLTSSEEDAQAYQTRLFKLMELLNQMRMKPATPAQVCSDSSSAVMEGLQRELQEAKAQLEASTELIGNLQEQIQLRESTIEKLQEDLLKASAQSSEETSTALSKLRQELQEVKGQAEATKVELKSCRALSENLQKQTQEREMMIAMLKDQLHRATGEVDRSELQQELQNVKLEAATTKEQLNSYIERNLKLQEHVQAGETSMSQLREELQQVRAALSKSEEEKEKTPSRKKPGKPSLLTSSTQPSVEVGTQTEMPGSGPGADLEELIGEYTERIGQIRELHAAEIMDMENRHIAESENLKREKHSLEVECDRLRTSIRNLPPAISQAVRADPPVFRDGYSSDSSSDVGSELRITPEGAHPDDLPNRIKALLREVHQEGMQVLSLSELSIGEGSADHSALLAEITHLRSQIAQLQQQQHHTVDTTGVFEPQRGREDECERTKSELAQVKLELETSLKTQHNYLRELDTLRAEVCMKASELDSVTDRLAEEQKRARELQWEVERERSRAERKAEREMEELEDVRLVLEEERRVSAQREAEHTKHLNLHTQLQVQLDSQRCQLNELTSDLQKEKEINAKLIKQLQRPPQVEDSTPSVADGVLQSLQAQLREKQAALVELMEQLEQRKLKELQQRQVWEEERTHLSHQVDELQSLLQGERERGKDTERARDRLQRTVTEMAEKNSQGDRTLDWVFQQKSDKVIPAEARHTSALNPTGETDVRSMESVIAKLQLISSKINRLTVDNVDRESVSWIQRNVQDAMSLLQKHSSSPLAVPESTALLARGSSSTLTERLLRQNAELTGFVSRLTEEKNELRNQMLTLEEELRRLHHLQSLRTGSDGQELTSSTEWEVWKKEKNRLEKSLHQAEAEVSRLQREIRSETLRDLTASDTENTTLKRVYGKYLRSESFRKALIYQKKYLLLLLGGFQECEEATLSLIARMAGPHLQTHAPRLDCTSPRRHGYTRFRTAARVCIAVSRMRFLVRRWQRVTGGSIIISRNGLGQNPGMVVRNDSPYLQPYTERRGTNRERTGRDLPHTTHTTQHRFGLMSADGVLCSHLQNYDPDRALTDYITRLEALQRRLGAVQSGSSTMHFGLRR